MRGPTCIVWANRTPCSLQALEWYTSAAKGTRLGAGESSFCGIIPKLRGPGMPVELALLRTGVIERRQLEARLAWQLQRTLEQVNTTTRTSHSDAQ